jgi:hypothetical protein
MDQDAMMDGDQQPLAGNNALLGNTMIFER